MRPYFEKLTEDNERYPEDSSRQKKVEIYKKLKILIIASQKIQRKYFEREKNQVQRTKKSWVNEAYQNIQEKSQKEKAGKSQQNCSKKIDVCCMCVVYEVKKPVTTSCI